jgi:predicted amidophosphoribosyltransferase
MKKTECVVCSREKGRRKCDKYDQQLLCSKCCAELRDSECETCRYFKAAKQYRSLKKRNVKQKHFILELKEEVETQVDDALDLIEKGNTPKGKHILEQLKVVDFQNK